MEPQETEPLIQKNNTSACCKKNSSSFVIFVIMYLTGFTILLLYCITNNKPEITTYNNEKWIYIIRHCEKLKDRDMGLSDIGIEHSLCLVPYFQTFPLGKPQIAFSSYSKTRRAIHTLIPITNAFNISFSSDFKTTETYEFSRFVLNELVKYDRIIIAWEHIHIPRLLQHLGCNSCKSWNNDPFSNEMTNAYNIVFALKYYNTSELSLLRVYNDNFINNECVKDIKYEYKEFI
jgi:hypothetical protein